MQRGAQFEPIQHWSARRRRRGFAHVARLLSCAAVVLAASGAHAQMDAPRLHAALQAACGAQPGSDAVLAAIGGGIEVAVEELDAPRGMLARRHRLLLPGGDRLRVDRHRRDGHLTQVILEVEQRIAGSMRPRWWVVADGECRLRVARRLDYRDSGVAEAVQLLDASLHDGDSRLALDAAVPPGAVPQGVPVAMVDSGVNYTLASIAARLARDEDGAALGYDYWDLDPRPFDSHPSRSPFLPQRHGTRTASLLLADAPVATLVPMRYPRADMSRMVRLVADAAAHGIGIVNLSLGGNEREDWRAFEAAARANPQILFIASAGNDGHDLDAQPIYPAALTLDNLITVSSSDAQGLPARGSNWGRDSVHLLVPAEGVVVTDFSGYATVVAGSSYAAARVSALAACLKAAHPQWDAVRLKQAIFERAEPPVHQQVAYVAVGVLPDPTLTERGACAAEPSAARRLGRVLLDEAAVDPHGAAADAGHVLAPLSLVWIEHAGWTLDELPGVIASAAGVLRQCDLRLGSVTIELMRLPRRQRYFDTATAMALMRTAAIATPAVWFMRDTLQQPAFDAQAIGRSNLGGRAPLLNTVWMTSQLEQPGVALAHELYHIIANTGGHVPEPDNLMHSHTSAAGTRLTDWQCERLLKVGGAFGLVRAAE